MSTLHVVCASVITNVTVYARGALIQRRIEVPEQLSAETLTLTVADISPLALPGSFQAIAEGGRTVSSLRTRFVIPDARVDTGEVQRQLAEAKRARERLRQEHLEITNLRNAFTHIQPQLRLKTHQRQPATRMADALSVVHLLHESEADLATRIEQLDQALESSQRHIDQLEMRLSQASRSERTSANDPQRTAHITLAPGTEPLTALHLHYRIHAARWLPAYTVRLQENGQAKLELEALVAQRSGEDWQEVNLALSTADMINDTDLPRLPSWRLGRAQPPPKHGWRPPPPDLDRLFEPFDRFKSSTAPPAPALSRRPAPAPPPEARPTADFACEDRFEASAPSPEPFAREQTLSRGISAKKAKISPMSPRASLPMEQEEDIAFGGAPAGARTSDTSANTNANLTLEPDEQWLNFDNLELADSFSPQRGKLLPSAEPQLPQHLANANALLDQLETPTFAVDPLNARGHFDTIVHCTGAIDVGDNGRFHRIAVQGQAGTTRMRFRAVPINTSKIYREARIINPFDAPLLSGPVDVFLHGALLTTSHLPATDRGGEIVIGLGEEERLRIARNTNVEESTSGLFGGTTQITHRVSLQLSSALNAVAEIEVIERLPITTENDIEVALGPCSPVPMPYEQSERGKPVRGGLRWLVHLAAGGEQTLSLSYTITLPSKRELIGGNRRD